MSHLHSGNPSLTQNQGNSLGERPAVRQSETYRSNLGGGDMAAVMGGDGYQPGGDYNTQQPVRRGRGGGATGSSQSYNILGDGHDDHQQQQQQVRRGRGNGATGSSQSYDILGDGQNHSQHDRYPPQQHQPPQHQQQPQAARRGGRGGGNQSSQGYNILTGE